MTSKNKFEPGERVRHKASGEEAIVVEMAPSGDGRMLAEISWGFGKNDLQSAASLERVSEQPEQQETNGPSAHLADMHIQSNVISDRVVVKVDWDIKESGTIPYKNRQCFLLWKGAEIGEVKKDIWNEINEFEQNVKGGKV